MSELVTVSLADGVATITLDDGKVNALSPAMQAAIHAALDQAEAAAAAVVLAGRDGVLSAGFDLKVLRSGATEALEMVIGGFELAARLLEFACPVVIACTGHAIAMGAFLLTAGDHRVGADGEYRITANEVAIGLTMPHAAIELVRQRLTPAAVQRAVLLAEVFSPATGVDAGWLDQLVAPADVVATAQAVAAQAMTLDPRAHAGSKRSLRATSMASIRAAIALDRTEFRVPAAGA